MLQKKTVIITGAGASLAYGMPTTNELRRRIISHCQQDHTVQQLTDLRGKQLQSFQHKANRFAQAFEAGGSESIDQFLAIAEQEEFRDIGKMSMSQILLSYFKNSVGNYWSQTLPDKDDDWLQYLLGRMSDEVTKYEDYINNPVSFITFNYDLVIERHLHAVKRFRYGVQTEGLDFDVHHVYGSLQLPYDQQERKFDFSIKPTADAVRVIGETERQHDFWSSITDVFQDAEEVIVIGFGWLPDNIRQLPWEHLDRDCIIHCGVKGVALPARKRLLRMLEEHGVNFDQIEMHDEFALQMIREEVNLLAADDPRDDDYMWMDGLPQRPPSYDVPIPDFNIPIDIPSIDLFKPK